MNWKCEYCKSLISLDLVKAAWFCLSLRCHGHALCMECRSKGHNNDSCKDELRFEMSREDYENQEVKDKNSGKYY